MTVACGKNMTTMIEMDLEEGTEIYIPLKIIIPSLLFHVALLICDVGSLPHSTSEQNELCIWLSNRPVAVMSVGLLAWVPITFPVCL